MALYRHMPVYNIVPSYATLLMRHKIAVVGCLAIRHGHKDNMERLRPWQQQRAPAKGVANTAASAVASALARHDDWRSATVTAVLATASATVAGAAVLWAVWLMCNPAR
eukprot:357494-Chlamydomonas_euryale.AAC.2